MKSQSSFSGNDIKSKLEGYKEFKKSELINVKPGDKVRYITNNEFRGGGVVKINKFPEYIVLLNVIKNVTWCMQIKSDPTLVVYVKTKAVEQKEKEKKEKEFCEMKKIFEMYKSGKLEKKK